MLTAETLHVESLTVLMTLTRQITCKNELHVLIGAGQPSVEVLLSAEGHWIQPGCRWLTECETTN